VIEKKLTGNNGKTESINLAKCNNNIIIISIVYLSKTANIFIVMHISRKSAARSTAAHSPHQLKPFDLY